MEFQTTGIPGVCLVKPDIYRDQRGFFQEVFNRQRYEAGGMAYDFVQDNMSRSQRGTVRGLHYQLKQPQGKLVFVLQGEIFDVAVDIRRQSPTFRQWFGCRLNDENRHQLFVPPGFAHGFMVLSETAEVYYKCTAFYRPDDEYGLLWNDPEIAIGWPDCGEVLLSPKDLAQPTLRTIDPEHLPL